MFFFTILFFSAVISKSLGTEYSPGYMFKDCLKCPEMIVIPSGTFFIGSKKGKKRELPVKKVRIRQPLAVGRYEITFKEWDACYDAGACAKKPSDRGWGRGNRPVINILHSDIVEYLNWLKFESGYHYRLPSEAEWEYAAKSGTNSEYSWGDQMIPGYANCRGCGTKWGGKKTAPVGQFKPNAWGLFDFHGNVLEHVTDCWTANHKTLPLDGSPVMIENCVSKVVKGGSWYYLPKVSRSASRVRNDIRVFSYFIGFRVFRDIIR